MKANTQEEYVFISIGSDQCIPGNDFSIGVFNGDYIGISSCNLGNFVFSSLKLKRDQWNFIVITLSQTNKLTSYLNGFYNNQTITANNINTQYNTIEFGRRLINKTTPNAGYLTDIRIWERVISIEEISTVQNFQNVIHGLVAYWDGYVHNNKLIDYFGNFDGTFSDLGIMVNTCNNGILFHY